jgi:O-methyltransferase domain
MRPTTFSSRRSRKVSPAAAISALSQSLMRFQGAYAYYIRRCMHDYSDENCAIVLRHLGDVLHPDGRVLIVEQIMSNPPSQLSAQTDLCMLNIGGKERSAADFEALTKAAGLKIVKIHKSEATDVGLVECVKA